ncbi:MAG: nodulation protein NfeD [Candidatus Binatia bacterium]
MSGRHRCLLLTVIVALQLGTQWTPCYATGPAVYKIVVNGPISPAVADFISSSILYAHERGGAALVIQLDTPGGLLSSTKTIAKELLASPVPIVVWVGPPGAGAISAGVFVTLAAHVAAMAPGTTIGAAHPVSGQGQDIEGDMRDKVENYAVSFVQSLAGRRGRNVEWAAQAVRESVAVTEVEAVELRVVDFVASSVEEILHKAQGLEVNLDGETVRLDFESLLSASGGPVVEEIEQTLRQKVLGVITDPNIAYLLMMAGMLGLYMEFSHPGAIFPGVAGAICLLLALLASQVLPINSTGVLLLVLGMAFLLAELFLPSFGVLGFGGIVALTLGSLFLYTPESELFVARGLVWGTVGTFGAVMAAVLFLLVRDRKKPSVVGVEGLVGERGVSVSTVHHSGTVKVHGEFWKATSALPVAANRPIRVVAVDGLCVRIEEIQV